MRASLLVGVLVLLSVLVVSFATDESDVTVLTKDNFDDFIRQDLAVVEFYAPWCGHCKQLAPEYAAAATELKGQGVSLGKLDATVESAVASKFEITGYPTLKIFRNGKASDYQGGRTTDTIVSYLKKQTGPAARILTDRADVDAFIKLDTVTHFAVVGFFNTKGKPQQQSSSFALLAPRLRDDFLFARVNDNSQLLSHYIPNGPAEGIVAFLNGEPTLYKGSPKLKELEEWYRDLSLPQVGRFTEKNRDLYNKRGLPTLKFFMKKDGKWNGPAMKAIRDSLAPIASQFRGKLALAVVDRSEFVHESTDLGLEDMDRAFSIVDVTNQHKVYKFGGDVNTEINVDEVSKWVKSFLAGKLTAHVKSQKEPVNNNGPVKTVVGTNFDDIVNDEEKDVMIEFYAPWCGHCKQLEPTYKRVGEYFQSAGKKFKNIVVAKIDATANDYDRERFQVQGYPTIFFRAAGDDEIEKFEGGREVDDFVHFIKQNAKSSKPKKKKNSKKKKKSDDDDDDDD